MDKVLAFVTALEEKDTTYTMATARNEAVIVTVAVPGERLAVEFLACGTVELERLISTCDVDAARGDTLAAIIEAYDVRPVCSRSSRICESAL